MSEYSDRFLLTIHGVNSDNTGLKKIRKHCEKTLPGLLADSHYYGRRIPFKDIGETTAEAIFRHVKDKIELIYLKHLRENGRKFYIVAHSYGTLAAIKAISMGIPNVTIEGLLLLGSIVPRMQHWDGFVDNGILKYPPLVIVRPHDRIVRTARLVGGGDSGSRGFIANGHYLALETFKNGKHNSYYPDDCVDIVQAIKDGVNSVNRISYEDWLSSQSFLGRMFAP